jgi:hypothetical protein
VNTHPNLSSDGTVHEMTSNVSRNTKGWLLCYWPLYRHWIISNDFTFGVIPLNLYLSL